MSSERTQASAAAAGVHVSSKNLVQSVSRNAAAQLVGRNLISLGRLVVAASIVRIYGKDTFGAYSLVLVLLGLAEWVLDFGTSDVFVREICQRPERTGSYLRMVTALKVLQIGAAGAVLALLLFGLEFVGLGFPTEVVHGGLVGLMSLVFFGGALVYHVLFKATLTIEREVAAELVSVLVMIALVRSITPSGATVPLIVVCHTVSRATFFLLCYLLGRARFPLSLRGVNWTDVRWSLQTSSAIGTIGMIVILYESVDVLLLNGLATIADVAYYYGAQRYIIPIVATLSTIGGTLYPVAASFWPGAHGKFEQSCQRAIDVVFALAGMAVAGILAGSDFLMRLLGPELAPGSQLLRLLAVVLFFKAVSATLGPVLYIVRAETHALGMVAVALVAKVVLILALVPRFGVMGAAASALIVDLTTAVITLYLLRRSSGFRLRWAIPAKAMTITAVAAFTPSLLFSTQGPLAAVAAVTMFIALSFLTGTVRLSDVLPLLKWKTS